MIGELSHGAEETLFGGLNVVGMNIEGRPVAHAVVLLGSDGNDAQLGMLAK